MSESQDQLSEAIYRALQARKKAVLLPKHTTQVGACLYTLDGEYYIGFNIQNRCHKSYHAEELAVLNAILHNADPSKFVGMTITYSANSIPNLTFACGHCRTYLWEYTKNPNLMIYEVTLEGKIIEKMSLGELYPYPYPR